MKENDKKKDKALDDMTVAELKSALQAFAAAQYGPAAAVTIPDEVANAIMAKSNELLTPADRDFLRAESLKVLREGW